MNRRTFLQTSLAAAAASGFASDVFGQNRKVDRIGLQLYSVRDLMKADLPGTLAKVAAVGFKEVELAGLFDRTPKEFRSLLDKSGLSTPSSHVDWATVENKLPETLNAARILGQQFIIVPYVGEAERKQPDIWKKAADLFNRVGAESLKSGIQFAYHQHGFEFVPSDAIGGKLPYDYLLENTDPKLVKMELDICWIVAAEQDPVAYVNRYPGRFPLVHVKDWLKDGSSSPSYAGALGAGTKFTGRMANVGQGSIDWRRIFAQSDKAGIAHYIIEHDNPPSPFEDLGGSFKYVQNLRF
jgi:sugar phosphate isomerase/epimerase